jgi:Na+/H+ antiporter NhaD/arsenite permease-like protein
LFKTFASLVIVILMFLSPLLALAANSAGATPHKFLDLSHQLIGYLSVFITVAAYVAAMSEEVTAMRKSKPMVLGSALVWFLICSYYALHGQAKIAALAFESNLLAYIEFLLFILVSRTYLNTLEECGIFRTMQIYLLSKRFSYKKLFWITGSLSFLLSTVVNGMTIAMLMGSIAMVVGKRNPEFIGLACINIICATNAGSTFSPLGGVSTLFVWQQNILSFGQFLLLAIPCLVNYLIPAAIMHFWVPEGKPVAINDVILIKRGAKRVIFLFGLTLVITIAGNVLLELPPAAGMMAGLGLLQLFNYYLIKTNARVEEERDLFSFYKMKSVTLNDPQGFDVFRNIGKVDWDTLLFFYGAMMIIGAMSFLGYLDAIARFLFGQISPTLANISIGLSSAFIDNGTLMFAVLQMEPDLSQGQWLLLTLSLGVGGSLLAIGSAPGVGMLGHVKGYYTFVGHLRWFPVILLGYFASIAVHFWLNANYF